MDNLTHSLTGIALAETVYFQTSSPPERPLLRRYLWLAALLASNFPDTDLLYSWISGPRIGYLLHHRGHTHTLIGLLPQALLTLSLVWGVLRLRHASLQKKEWGTVGIATFLSLVLHLAMDGLNSYGVHPFWPWNNRWFYGDSVFIVEPFLWFLLLPVLRGIGPSKVGNRVFWFLSVVAWALILTATTVPVISKIALAVFFALSTWALSAVTLKWRAAVSLVVSVVLIIGFIGVSRFVHQGVRAALTEGSWNDIVASPFPANPLCWSVIAVGERAGNYRLQAGTWAPFTSLRSAEECGVLRSAPGALALDDKDANEPVRLRWKAVYELSAAEWQRRQDSSCYLRAALRFFRAPFFGVEARHQTIGDLRFGSGGFSDLELPDPDFCPPFVPPWDPPTKKNAKE